MDEVEFEHRLTAVELLAKNNAERIGELKDLTKAVNEVATSVKVVVMQQEQVVSKVDKLDSKVEALESKPAKKYENLAEKVIWALVYAAIGFVLAHIGL